MDFGGTRFSTQQIENGKGWREGVILIGMVKDPVSREMIIELRRKREEAAAM